MNVDKLITLSLSLFFMAYCIHLNVKPKNGLIKYEKLEFVWVEIKDKI